MKKFKLSRLVKTTVIAITILIAIPVVLYFYAKINQVSQAEADKVCQEFFEQVKSDITKVPGYTIIKGEKSCRPDIDEAGFTDYYFSVTFRVSKSDNNTVAAIKSNINYLSDKLPQKNYPVWVRNDAAKMGQPETICVMATRQIQEDGSDYQSSPPKHYPDYSVPGSIEGFAPCGDLWTVPELAMDLVAETR